MGNLTMHMNKLGGHERPFAAWLARDHVASDPERHPSRRNSALVALRSLAPPAPRSNANCDLRLGHGLIPARLRRAADNAAS